MAFTLAKNATKPNPFEIISLQTTRNKNNWKSEETLARAVVTLETERIKGPIRWCLWWWWWWWWWWWTTTGLTLQSSVIVGLSDMQHQASQSSVLSNHKWSVSCTGLLPWRKGSRYFLNVMLSGPTAGTDNVTKRSQLCQESNSDFLAVLVVVYPQYTLNCPILTRYLSPITSTLHSVTSLQLRSFIKLHSMCM